MTAVSVLLSAFNAEPYLREALDSIIAQTFHDWDMIVIDDGSTDGTAEIVESICDPRISVVRQVNSGLHVALNRALSLAQGNVVMRMDADDTCHPDRMRQQFMFLTEHPEVDVVGCQCLFFGNNGAKYPALPLPCSHEDIVGMILRGGYGLSHPTIMARRTAIDRAGRYQLPAPIEDWDLYLRLIRTHAHFANLPNVLYHMRIHPGSVSWLNPDRIHIGQAYVRAVRNNMLDPHIHSFPAFYENRRRKLSCRIRDWSGISSLRHYRQAIYERLYGRRLAMIFHLLLAAACSPSKAFRAIARLLGRNQRSLREETPKDP